MSRLLPSTPDDINLALAVEHRFIELCSMYRRVRGVDLVPPVDLDLDVRRWREMRIRHKRNDFRHTEAELKSVQEVATWTVQVKAAMCGKGPKHIVWRDEAGLENPR